MKNTESYIFLEEIYEKLKTTYNTDTDKIMIYIITTILTGSFVLYGTFQLNDKILKFFLILSLFLNIISLLSFIRYTVRTPRKVAAYKKKISSKFDITIKEFKEDFASFTTTYLIPGITENLRKVETKLNAEEWREKLSKEVENVLNKDKFINRVVTSYTTEVQKKLQTKEMQLLDEKLPRVNLIIDNLSEKIRYAAFSVALLFLSAFIIYNLI